MQRGSLFLLLVHVITVFNAIQYVYIIHLIYDYTYLVWHVFYTLD